MPENTKKTTTKGAVKTANQRGAARLAAVQALYQMDIGGTDLASVLTQFAVRTAQGDVDGETYLPADVDFLGQIVKGVLKHQLTLDPVLHENLSDDWPLVRIDSTLRAVLRAGAFELIYRRDIPPKVVISEYVDVANAFFDGEVPGMVNAVLDKISNNLPTES
ncbi:MAG TPA: transcription antitermination factor NusB [Devosia sp.]|nr:transcription antitermination factor NusB [Devosia sp.]